MPSLNAVMQVPELSSRPASLASLRDKLSQLFSKVKLPSSPALATRILELTEDPDASIDDFASVIRLDGALSARLLKMSNSASLGQRTPVTTIPKAVTVLGLSRVKTAALGFQLVGHLNKLGSCPFDMTRYWQQAVLRGCVARELAGLIVPRLREEAFLVGLLQDTGVLLLVQILGREYADLYQKYAHSHATFYAHERTDSRYAHVEASAVMAQEWKLPDAIATPIAGHHTPPSLAKNPTDVDRLTAVTYLVGSMRFAQRDAQDQADDFIRDYATTKLKLDEAKLQRCFADAAKMYEQTAALLGETLPDDLDVAELLGQANVQLTAAAGQAEDKVNTVVAERQVLEAKQAELSNVLGEVTKRASTDPLTGLLNRGALCEAVAALVSGAVTSKSSLSIAFLDVDNFKKLNDTYGHKIGDEVLKAVANAIMKVGHVPGCAGRYGGEEFIVVMPNLSEGEAHAFGESVCNSIREIDFRALSLAARVTASVGVAHGHPTAGSDVEAAFAAADGWMYKAKKSGKDRCVVGELVAPLNADAALPVGIPAAVGVKPATIQAIASQMNTSEVPPSANVRSEPREKLALGCKIAVFTEAFQLRTETGCVRNLSPSGMSLLVSRAIASGQPVEAAIQLPDKSVIYLAGVVAHSRMIRDFIHEVGVKVSTTSRQPIFSSNPTAALVSLPWLAQALRSGL